MKTMTETLRELRLGGVSTRPKRFSELVEQFAQVHEEIRSKQVAKVVRQGNRPRCVHCDEKVGRCVMRRPK